MKSQELYYGSLFETTILSELDMSLNHILESKQIKLANRTNTLPIRKTKEFTDYRICTRVTAFSDLFCLLLYTKKHS